MMSLPNASAFTLDFSISEPSSLALLAVSVAVSLIYAANRRTARVNLEGKPGPGSSYLPFVKSSSPGSTR